MADIEIRRGHQLGLKAARAVADRMAESLGRKFGLNGDWEGNVLRFQRPGVTGSLSVDDRAMHLSVSLGLLLKAMKGSIERAVNDELDKLLAAAPAPAKPAARSKKAPAPKKKGG